MECIVTENASLVEDEELVKEEQKVSTSSDFTDRFKALYSRVLNLITPQKKDANGFKTAFRMFRLATNSTVVSPSTQVMRVNYSRAIGAVYVFRLYHPHKDGYTHGIHMRLNGFLNRYIFESLIDELVFIVTNKRLSLKAYVPVITKNVSPYDYFQSLYILPTNLILNYTHHSDAVSESQLGIKNNSGAMSALKSKMQTQTNQIIDTMIAMPSRYPFSYLYRTLQLDLTGFRKHMRSTNIVEIMGEISKDAYSIALQDPKFKVWDVQELMDPLTRRSMINRCITDKATKQTQELFNQRHNKLIFVHPHPYNGIIKSELHCLKPLDGMIFDPRFLFSVLMTARWFVRACMLEEDAVSNNNAHLLLYGGPGTGKTLIMSAISSSIPTYKYMVTSRFQNPELLQSSLISIEEFDTSALPCNQYKQLLDIKTHLKIDFKNLNPENVTEGVPCMITTNDDVFTILKTQKKYNQNSINAALRRLYIVPMKAGQFEKIHGRLPIDHPHYNTLTMFNPKFDKETDKLERIFNLIMGFALFQQDVRGLYFDPRMHTYIQKLVKDFKQTAFGTFYLSRKAQVDEIIQEAEFAMKHEDVDDSAYLVKISTCVGQFQQLQYQFLESMMKGKTGIDFSIIKDKTVPWPIKTYYLMSSDRFIVNLMWETEDYQNLLNPEVNTFLNNPMMHLYRPVEEEKKGDEYVDLKQIDESYQDSSLSLEEQKAPENLNVAQLDIESMLSKRTISEVFGIEEEMKVRDFAKEMKDWEERLDQDQLLSHNNH